MVIRVYFAKFAKYCEINLVKNEAQIELFVRYSAIAEPEALTMVFKFALSF